MGEPLQLELERSVFEQKLTDTDFAKLSSFIYKSYGIKMPAEKRVMLQCRLQKRLKELCMASFEEYISYVFGKNGHQEAVLMMNHVSTNKTDFFREPNHFEFLSNELIPSLYARGGSCKSLKIWSAGCSSGEEVYTLAMVLQKLHEQQPLFDFQVLGTDISTKVLQAAVDAIYKNDRAAFIPLEYKQKYLLRSKDPAQRCVRIAPELRKKTSFARLNLMDDFYDVSGKFDIIFCRNVLIYFDKATQETVINKLCEKLKTGGYFFLGHSESIIGMNVPLKQVRPTIFTKL